MGYHGAYKMFSSLKTPQTLLYVASFQHKFTSSNNKHGAPAGYNLRGHWLRLSGKLRADDQRLKVTKLSIPK